MSLDSIIFISCFLPLMLALHWLVPQKGRTAVLLALSLAFYAFCGLPALLVLVLSIGVNFGLSLLLHKKWGKVFLFVGIAGNAALLGVYKYLDFLLSQLGLGQAVTGLAAPLGISFFTFKCIAFLADVYKGQVQRPRFPEFALYVSFFPQIAMGPITRYGEFAPQLQSRSLSLEGTVRGIRRFVVGLAKRVVLSAPLGALVDGVYAAALPTLPAPMTAMCRIKITSGKLFPRRRLFMHHQPKTQLPLASYRVTGSCFLSESTFLSSQKMSYVPSGEDLVPIMTLPPAVTVHSGMMKRSLPFSE